MTTPHSRASSQRSNPSTSLIPKRQWWMGASLISCIEAIPPTNICLAVMPNVTGEATCRRHVAAVPSVQYPTAVRGLAACLPWLSRLLRQRQGNGAEKHARGLHFSDREKSSHQAGGWAFIHTRLWNILSTLLAKPKQQN